MFSFLRNLFGPKADIAALHSSGAKLIDVRTPKEFSQHSIPGSSNHPVQSLKANLNAIGKKEDHYIVYCASGVRSGMAKKMMKANGFENVVNGGGIQSVFNKIS